MSQKQNKPLPISVEQSKLLGNTLRVKIIGILAQTPKTAKQVATELGESPGNIHYHMQLLYKGNLIDLVEEKRVGGVVEKYYKARSISFQSDHGVYRELEPGFQAASSTTISSALHLTEEDKEKLIEEFRALIVKWVGQSLSADYKDVEEYVIGVNLVSRKEKENDQIKKGD